MVAMATDRRKGTGRRREKKLTLRKFFMRNTQFGQNEAGCLIRNSQVFRQIYYVEPVIIAQLDRVELTTARPRSAALGQKQK